MEFAKNPEFAKAMQFAKNPEFAKAMAFAKNPEFAKAMEFAKNPAFAKAIAFAKNPGYAAFIPTLYVVTCRRTFLLVLQNSLILQFARPCHNIAWSLKWEPKMVR
jgi:hypothetical protein